MLTETRQSRTHVIQYSEYHPRRRHHTLDNATLDKFDFICIPLNLDEARIHSSLSQSNLSLISTTHFSIPRTTILSSPTRRVRFKFEENDRNQISTDLSNSRHTHSSEDVRLSKNNSIHRVEFQIPIHSDINPWLNVVSSSTPTKTRSLTSQKIDINYNNKMMRPQNISPYIETNVSSATLPTAGSDKTQTQWYKEMYHHVHKSPETKKDVILVKLPPTPSRYREYEQQRDDQQNPYKPTYTFPEEFDSNLQLMEDYIRKAASQNIDYDYKNSPSSAIRTPISNVKDDQPIPSRTTEKIIRFDDQSSSASSSSSAERVKSHNDALVSSIPTNSRSNTNYNVQTPTSTTDDEQKSIYKRILHGGDIPTSGLQKISLNNRVSSSSVQRPLILTNHPQLSTKLFAYYSVHWQQNQTSQLNTITNRAMHFEINSCLYFQTTNPNDNNDDEWEEKHEDGCGYVITYPSDNLQIYNFDRTKNFLLTSNDVYSNSKRD